MSTSTVKRDLPNLNPMLFRVNAIPRFVRDGEMQFLLELTYDGEFVTSLSAVPLTRMDSWFKEALTVLGVKISPETGRLSP